MKGKQKLMTLLGSAVLFGLGAEGVAPSYAGEGKCAGMNKGSQQKTKEATCAGMKKEEKEKGKKKTKEMTCGGPGVCGGKMKPKEGSNS